MREQSMVEEIDRVLVSVELKMFLNKTNLPLVTGGEREMNARQMVQCLTRHMMKKYSRSNNLKMHPSIIATLLANHSAGDVKVEWTCVTKKGSTTY